MSVSQRDETQSLRILIRLRSDARTGERIRLSDDRFAAGFAQKKKKGPGRGRGRSAGGLSDVSAIQSQRVHEAQKRRGVEAGRVALFPFRAASEDAIESAPIADRAREEGLRGLLRDAEDSRGGQSEQRVFRSSGGGLVAFRQSWRDRRVAGQSITSRCLQRQIGRCLSLLEAAEARRRDSWRGFR